MKIYRTELVSDIDKKIFEIDVDQIGLNDVEFSSNIINGFFTVDNMSQGFHIKGNIDVPYRLQCDRCLTNFEENRIISFNIILTDDDQLNYNESDDIIHFPPSEDEFDLKPLFQELIQLELQMKILCRTDCAGLCSNCGLNLNEQECHCSKEKVSSTWEALKNL